MTPEPLTKALEAFFDLVIVAGLCMFGASIAAGAVLWALWYVDLI